MRVTRAAIFETNSSSTHSISIAGDVETPDVFPVNGDICEVYPGEFGWEEDTHHSATMKASYCLTYAMGFECGDIRDELSKMLKEVLKERTGKEVKFVPLSGDNLYKWGYIDHQSSDVCAEAFLTKKDLHNFIFNPESWLQTDNDNH